MAFGEKGSRILELNSKGIPKRSISKQTGVNYHTVCHVVRMDEAGITSFYEYRKSLAENKGSTVKAEMDKAAQRRGFKSNRAYREHTVEQRGFKSLRDYQRHLALNNIEKIENIALRTIIEDWLFDNNASIGELARKLKLPKSTVHSYSRGEATPNGERAKKLLEFFGYDHCSLECLVGETIDG